jgi:hypothetical protein
MQFTALQSPGMHTAIPSSGANAVGIGLVARPALPSCREPHDLPDAPLSAPAKSPADGPAARLIAVSRIEISVILG